VVRFRERAWRTLSLNLLPKPSAAKGLAILAAPLGSHIPGSAKLDATFADPAVPRTQAASATSSRERPSLSVLAHQTSSSSIRLAKSSWKG
jgi:hypothetical protein